MIKNNILVINSSNQFWGAESSLMILLKNLNPESYKLIVRSDGNGFDAELDRNNIGYNKYNLELSPFKKNFFVSVLHLLKVIYKSKIRIIYANNEDLSSLIAVIRVITFLFIKTKLHIRNTPGQYDYYKKLMFIHNDVICNSNYTKDQLLNNLNLYSEKKIHIVPNSHGQSLKKTITPCNDYKNYFLSIGRINEPKAQFDVIKALNEVYSRSPINFLMVGKYPGANPYLTKIEEYLSINKLNDRVFINAFKEDLSSEYFNAIATIISSRNETFGRVVIESGYYGTPVIVRNIPPLLELIEDGQNGLVWDGSKDHLIKLIKLLSNDQEYRNFLGKNLQEFVKNNYSDHSYSTKVNNIIMSKD